MVPDVSNGPLLLLSIRPLLFLNRKTEKPAGPCHMPTELTRVADLLAITGQPGADPGDFRRGHHTPIQGTFKVP
jgi:hypothetical protein